MNWFKNFKTKRQLREEIARLQGILSVPQHICTVEHDVQFVRATSTLNTREMPVPMDVIKHELARNLAKELERHIEWDVVDGTFPDEVTLVGTLRVATRR